MEGHNDAMWPKRFVHPPPRWCRCPKIHQKYLSYRRPFAVLAFSFLAGESVSLFPVDMAFLCVTVLLLIMQSCAVYIYNARKMQKSEYSGS